MAKARNVLKRAGLLFVLWLILTGGKTEAMFFGLVVSFLIALYLPFAPVLGVRFLRLPGFLFWFFIHSFKSGADVARRAWHPKRPLDPAVIDYECAPLNPLAARLFAVLVSLMPGTLSMAFEGSRLRVHVLDRAANPKAGLDELKNRVAALLL